MRPLLLKKLLKTKVYTSLGDLVGTVANIYIEKGSWEVKYAEVSTGWGRRNKAFYPVNLLIVAEGRNITILPENVIETVDPDEAKPYIPGKHLLGRDVYWSDGQLIGRLYDADVSISYKKWLLWKLLIRTGVKERRQRLDATTIEKVGKTIILASPAEEE